MFTRRSPQFAQAARLDEILVHAGNNQLPQDLEERSAQGFEFQNHTAHHGDRRLDHGPERPGIKPKSTLTTWVVGSHVQNGAAG